MFINNLHARDHFAPQALCAAALLAPILGFLYRRKANGSVLSMQCQVLRMLAETEGLQWPAPHTAIHTSTQGADSTQQQVVLPVPTLYHCSHPPKCAAGTEGRRQSQCLTQPLPGCFPRASQCEVEKVCLPLPVSSLCPVPAFLSWPAELLDCLHNPCLADTSPLCPKASSPSPRMIFLHYLCYQLVVCKAPA